MCCIGLYITLTFVACCNEIRNLTYFLLDNCNLSYILQQHCNYTRDRGNISFIFIIYKLCTAKYVTYKLFFLYFVLSFNCIMHDS